MNDEVRRLVETAREFVKVCRLVEVGEGIEADAYDSARIRLEAAILAVRESDSGR